MPGLKGGLQAGCVFLLPRDPADGGSPLRSITYSPCRDDEFGDLDVAVPSDLKDHSVSRGTLEEVEVGGSLPAYVPGPPIVRQERSRLSSMVYPVRMRVVAAIRKLPVYPVNSAINFDKSSEYMLKSSIVAPKHASPFMVISEHAVLRALPPPFAKGTYRPRWVFVG